LKATFNNQERDFNIKREHVPYLEHSLGRGLYAVLKDTTEGNWTFNDVAMVLSFALHGPGPDDRTVIGIARSAARMGFPAAYSIRYRPHPDVVAVLEAEGHGNFAGIMADVLTETIFGEPPATKVVHDEYGNEVEVPDVAA
jgi:hypothetical protein